MNGLEGSVISVIRHGLSEYEYKFQDKNGREYGPYFESELQAVTGTDMSNLREYTNPYLVSPPEEGYIQDQHIDNFDYEARHQTQCAMPDSPHVYWPCQLSQRKINPGDWIIRVIVPPKSISNPMNHDAYRYILVDEINSYTESLMKIKELTGR